MHIPSARSDTFFSAAAEKLATTPVLEAHHAGGYRFIEFPGGISLRMDAEGRWCSVQTGQNLIRRTLDGLWTRRRGERYVDLPKADQQAFYGHLQQIAHHLADRLHRDELNVKGEAEPGTVKDWLDAAGARSPTDYERETRFFQTIYPERIPIIPPDRYRDVVVQPATGCPHADCTFCAFYKDTRFQVLSADEFDEHLRGIKQFFGKAIESRNGIFLGSASALSLNQRRMLSILERLQAWMPNPKRGIAAFLDPDHAPRRSVSDFEELKKRGLRHVTIGLETGSPELRAHMGKSGDLQAVQTTVDQLKKADIRVALTILVGPGGPDAAAEHLEATTHAVSNLQLDRKDLMYLSPLDGSMNGYRLQQESHKLQQALSEQAGGRVSPYRMHLFRYFT